MLLQTIPVRLLAGLLVAVTLAGGMQASPAGAAPAPQRSASAVSTPRAVAAEVHGTTIALSWSRPSGARARTVDRYDVRYRIDGDLIWSTTVSTGHRSLRVRDLIGGRRTTFQVRARTEHAMGRWSAAVSAVPLSPPGAIRALRFETPDRSIRLTWSPPAQSGGRAVTGYEVQVRRSSGRTWRTASPSAARTVVRDLHNARRYAVRVRARTSAGRGPWTPVLHAVPGRASTAHLLARVVPTTDAPTGTSTGSGRAGSAGPAAADASTRSRPGLTLLSDGERQTTASSGGGAIREAVEAKATETGASASAVGLDFSAPVPDFSTSAAASSPAAVLDVSTGADGSDRLAPSPASASTSTSAAASAVASAPGSVSGLHGTATSTAVRLDWQAPAQGGPVASYEVRARGTSTSAWGATRVTATTSLSLDGLTDGVQYEFSVRASGAAMGPWSESVTARPVGPPSAPERPVLRFADRQLAVRASWSPGTTSDGGGTLGGWDLRYQVTGGSWTTLSTDVADAAVIDVGPLPGGFTYGFSLRARSDLGDGAWSSVRDLYVPVLTMPVLTIGTSAAEPITSTETYLNGAYALDPNGGASAAELPLEIKGRGNSTWGAAKKPYRLKLATEASLLGMPASKHWVLLANAFDHSLLRNETALYLGSKTRLAWTPRTRYVEVVLNGDYLGLYQLAEQVRIGKQRINIKSMSSADTSGAALTGGYQLERDGRLDTSIEPGFTSSLGQPIAIKDPEVPTSQQAAYIKDYFTGFEDALVSAQRGDSATGYARWIDVDSFVDWYVVEEYVQDVDANFASAHLYKPRGGLLTMGPLWDFDLALAGDARLKGKQREWYVKNDSWWVEFFKDPAWEARVESRWHALRQQLTDVESHVDTTRHAIATAAAGDARRWGYSDHDAEVAAVSTFLQERGSWLDEQWGTAD